MKFRTALVSITAVYALNWIGTVLGFYGRWPNYDVPMHFLGGLTIGMLGIAIHHAMVSKRHMSRVGLFYHGLFVVSFVMLVAVAWEFHEYILDNTVVIWYDLQKTQLSLSDTMADLALGGLGGLVSLILFKKHL